jgi:hypothetical protein
MRSQFSTMTIWRNRVCAIALTIGFNEAIQYIPVDGDNIHSDDLLYPPGFPCDELPPVGLRTFTELQ